MLGYKGEKKASDSLGLELQTVKSSSQVLIPRFHLISVRMAKITNTNDNPCWHRCGAKGTLLHAGERANLYSHIGKSI